MGVYTFSFDNPTYYNILNGLEGRVKYVEGHSILDDVPFQCEIVFITGCTAMFVLKNMTDEFNDLYQKELLYFEVRWGFGTRKVMKPVLLFFINEKKYYNRFL